MRAPVGGDRVRAELREQSVTGVPRYRVSRDVTEKSLLGVGIFGGVERVTDGRQEPLAGGALATGRRGIAVPPVDRPAAAASTGGLARRQPAIPSERLDVEREQPAIGNDLVVVDHMPAAQEPREVGARRLVVRARPWPAEGLRATGGEQREDLVGGPATSGGELAEGAEGDAVGEFPNAGRFV